MLSNVASDGLFTSTAVINLESSKQSGFRGFCLDLHPGGLVGLNELN